MDMSEIHVFIRSLDKAWQRSLCLELLDCIQEAAPQLEASIKWGNPYFEHNGAVLKWFVAKDWINVYFFRGLQISDPNELFIKTRNSKMRTMRFFEMDGLNTEATKALVAQAVRLNDQRLDKNAEA